MISPAAPRHLFVIGFFRSGTSLLYSFLNLHPKIRLLYEADVLNLPLISVAAGSGLDWWDRVDFYNSCCRRHRLIAQPDWKNARSAKAAAEVLYRAYAHPDSIYIGEKSPTYCAHLPRISAQFPQARFVVMWRHPQDVISSIEAAAQKHYFFRKRSLPLRAILDLEQMQSDVLALRAQGVQMFDLCYEDLLQSPKETLTSICDFLELPFDPAMLRLENADCSMLPPGEHHTNARSGRLLGPKRLSEPQTDIQFKVQRYFQHWKKTYGQRLATRRYWPAEDGPSVSFTETAVDRVKYLLGEFFSTQLTPFIYGFWPLSWLQAYRVWRGKTFAPSSSSDTAAVQTATGQHLTFSIVTPSYKQLPWLKLCAASVADQQGAQFEHIIQDAQSGSDLETWVHKHTGAKLFVECDTGMYDAINRGFARATGDILCWLNSDEQYLEGTLATVERFFLNNPQIDVLFGDAILVGNRGDLLSYRRTIVPNLQHIQVSHLNILSCATFVRRSVLERGYKLKTEWKAIADAVWISSLLEAGVPMALMNKPLSVFTITDKNLGQSSLATSEMKQWRRQLPGYTRWFGPIVIVWHRLMKLVGGAYWPRTLSIKLYTLASPNERVVRRASGLGFRWPT